LLVVLLMVQFLPAQPARAAVGVDMLGNSNNPNDTLRFSPETLTISVRAAEADRRVRWSSPSDGEGHTTIRNGVIGWMSAVVQPGQDWCCKLFKFAASYPYFCGIHPPDPEHNDPGMTGTIRMRPFVGRNGSSSIDLGQTATVRIAVQGAPSGFVFDIQRRTGTGDWTRWKRGVTNATYAYTPSSTGQKLFRSRVRRISDGETTGWSPAATLTVTN
jgi:hypothetical protein